MSKKAAEQHKKASEHFTHAAHHHTEAAKHHEAGNHEKAAHHAYTARSHLIHARAHADDAVKAHGEEHGRKKAQGDSHENRVWYVSWCFAYGGCGIRVRFAERPCSGRIGACRRRWASPGGELGCRQRRLAPTWAELARTG